MKILIVAADKGGHFAPFVEEQMQALQDLSHEVVRYAVCGKGVRGYLRKSRLQHILQRSRVLFRSSVPKHGSVCCRRGLPIRKWLVRCKPSILRSSRIKFCFQFYFVPCSACVG